MWDHKNHNVIVIRGSTNGLITKSLTQRSALSLASKVYEPSDLEAPFSIGSFLIVKDIRRVKGLIWDDQLPKTQLNDSLHGLSNCRTWLRLLHQIVTPRVCDRSQDEFSSVGFP